MKITLNQTWILVWTIYTAYCGDDWQIESHWSHELDVSGIQAGDCLNEDELEHDHVEMSEKEIEQEHEHEYEHEHELF